MSRLYTRGPGRARADFYVEKDNVRRLVVLNYPETALKMKFSSDEEYGSLSYMCLSRPPGPGPRAVLANLPVLLEKSMLTQARAEPEAKIAIERALSSALPPSCSQQPNSESHTAFRPGVRGRGRRAEPPGRPSLSEPRLFRPITRPCNSETALKMKFSM
jgi:hypothetical protein